MALPNDMSRIAAGLAKLESGSTSYSTSAKQAARNLIRRTYQLETASVFANGGDALAANVAPAVRARSAGRVLGVYLSPKGTASANVVNYANATIYAMDGAGNTGNALFTITTKPTANSGSGDLAKGTTISLTAGSDTSYARGAWLAAVIAQTASGVAFPACNWSIDVEEEAVDGYGV